MIFLTNLWWLLCAHALCDSAIQIPFKNPNRNQENWPDKIYGPWWWGMLAHSLINGAGVSFATGIWWLGIWEAMSHFILDTSKCLEWINTYEDQYGHISSKLVWAALAVSTAR